jgi:bifunctional non-homologous end joining protein LigD
VSAPLGWDEVATVKPERFTLTTMRKRIDDVGDLTKGMWRHKRSLIPLFPKLGLEPADPRKLDGGRRRGAGQRWTSEQGAPPRRPAQQQVSRRAKK